MGYDWLNASETPSYGFGYGMPSYGAALSWQQPAQNPLSGLLKSGAAAQYNFRGMDTKAMGNIAAQLSQLANASYDESNPIFQRLAGQERADINLSNAANIGEYIRQNRMQSRLGRRPLFDPERGGEMLFRQQMQQLNDSSAQARDRARQIIGVGQSGLNNALSAQTAYATAQDQNNKKKAFGFGNIADALPLLKGLF